MPKYFVSRIQHFEEYLEVEAASEEEAHDKFRDAIDSGDVVGHAYLEGDGSLLCVEINEAKAEIVSDVLCDLYDIKNMARLEGFGELPKDNEGTEVTIMDCIDNCIEQLSGANMLVTKSMEEK